MYLGNVMLLILNLPLVGLWVKLIRIPYSYLFPFIFLFCLLGAYAVRNNVFDIGMMIFFGIVGFFMRKFGYETAPFILAFILGPMFEEHFRRSLILSYGSFFIFIERPISAIFLGVGIFLLLSSLLPIMINRKKIIGPQE